MTQKFKRTLIIHHFCGCTLEKKLKVRIWYRTSDFISTYDTYFSSKIRPYLNGP